MSTRGGSKSASRGKTGKSGGGNPKYGAGTSYSSTRPVDGNGIFVTCDRGREGRCIGEMYDLLDQVANELYPPARLAEFELVRLSRKADQAAEGEVASTPIELVEAADVEEEEEEEEDQSIEASIARELAALKLDRPGRKPRNDRTDEGNGKALGPDVERKVKVKQPKPRFLSVVTNVECVVFFAVSWPYDPVEIVEHIIRQAREDGIARTRFTLRLEPVSTTCHALSVDVVKTLSERLIREHFLAWAEKHNTTRVTYYIDTSVRLHTQPLDRTRLLEILGSAVRSLASPNPSSADSPTLDVSVDITSADLVLNAVVLKNYFGLAVLDGPLWNRKGGRRFNLDGAAAQARKEIEERNGGNQLSRVVPGGGDGEVAPAPPAEEVATTTTTN